MLPGWVQNAVSFHVLWELQICHRAMWRDFIIAVGAGCTFSAVAATHHGYSTMDYLVLFPRALCHFILYIYSFNLCNQITGIEEDRINKPDRPIPSGLLTMQGAKYRWYITTVMYVLAGIAIGNIWSSLLWVFVTLMLCFGGWDKHWFSKNCIAMTLGTVALGWGGWSIVSGNPWMNQSYAVLTGVLSVYSGLVGNLQDLRDVEGDRKSGRKTMPIVIGLTASRRLLSIAFAMAPVIFHSTVWTPVTMFQVVYCISAVIMHLAIALRLLLQDNSASSLHNTYHFFTKTYPFTIVSVLILE